MIWIKWNNIVFSPFDMIVKYLGSVTEINKGIGIDNGNGEGIGIGEIQILVFIDPELGIKSRTELRIFDLEPFIDLDIGIDSVIEITIETGSGYQLIRYRLAEPQDKLLISSILKQDFSKTLRNSKLFKKIDLSNWK